MGIFQIALIGVGLAMDAFAVAVCKGLKMKKIDYRYTFLIALFFGGFQALMPFVGWLLGKQFEKYITSVDHWIVFALLGFIGVQMIIESFKKEEEDNSELKFDLAEICMLAVATSIDALGVGISFAFAGLNVSILAAVVIIGVITFLISSAGVAIGNRFGSAYKNKAELAGGLILVFIGIKILVEHLGIL